MRGEVGDSSGRNVDGRNLARHSLTSGGTRRVTVGRRRASVCRVEVDAVSGGGRRAWWEHWQSRVCAWKNVSFHLPKNRWVNVAMKLISMKRPTTASRAARAVTGSLSAKGPGKKPRP